MKIRMPLIFVGHGSPMNAIESNIYTENWKNIGKSLPTPRAILMLSAHWITEGELRISTHLHPPMIYDMYGFPPELYRVQYSVAGSPEIAEEIRTLLSEKGISILLDPTRGIDHGAWSALIHLYPDADIPVISMSLDYSAGPETLYNIGKSLQSLRDSGILIIGSGNIVHNLGAIDWSGQRIYDWAVDFDTRIADSIVRRDHKSLMNCLSWDIASLAHPSYDHLLPLFPLLGASDNEDVINFSTPDIVMGSLAMRCVRWG